MTQGPRIVGAQEAEGHADPLLPDDFEKMKQHVKALTNKVLIAQRPHEALFRGYDDLRASLNMSDEHLKLLDALFLHIILKDSITLTLLQLAQTIDYRAILSEFGWSIEKSINVALPPGQGRRISIATITYTDAQEDIEWALKIRDGVNQFARRLMTKGAGDNVVSVLDELLKKDKDESNDPNRPATKD